MGFSSSHNFAANPVPAASVWFILLSFTVVFYSICYATSAAATAVTSSSPPSSFYVFAVNKTRIRLCF